MTSMANSRSATAMSTVHCPMRSSTRFVDALAIRIASFDKEAVAETKRLVDVNSLPADAEIVPEWEAFLAALGRPAAQERIRTLFERGFHDRETSRHASDTTSGDSALRNRAQPAAGHSPSSEVDNMMRP